MAGIYAYLVSFFELQLINNVSLSEVISFLLIIISLFYIRRIKIEADTIFFFFFVVWVVVSYSIIISKAHYFSSSSYRNNTFRLILYFVGYLTIPLYFQQKSRSDIFFKHLIISSIIICIIGVIDFINIQLELGVDFRMSKIFINDASLKSFDRISSIFNEPAHLSIYIGTVMTLILRYYKGAKKTRILILLKFLAITNLILSMSLVGMTILVYLIYLMAFDGYSKKRTFLSYLKNVFVLIIALLFVSAIIVQVGFFNEMIFDRISTAINLDDTSSNQRLIGSYEYAVFVTSLFPFTGIGLGQLMPFFQGTNISIDFYYFNDERGGGVNNILSSILIQTGWVGLIFFILFVLFLFKKDKRLLFMFLILSFSWGFFNTSFFWFYLYVAKSLILNQQTFELKNRRHI